MKPMDQSDSQALRIFLGTAEVASVMYTYARGFAALGCRPYTLITARNPFYPDYPYDRVILANQRLAAGSGLFIRIARRLLKTTGLAAEFLKAALTHDIFVFLFGSSLLPRRLDYRWLRLLGKPIVCVFLGSDIRYGPAFEQEMSSLGVADEIRPFIDYVNSLPNSSYRSKRSIIASAERNASLILSQPGFGQLQTRPYMRVTIPIDLSLFEFHVPDRKVPLVLHAPSNRSVKGTDVVMASVDQLRREGVQFEFQLIENTPHSDLRRLLAASDIVVDELYSETIGVLSTEAMAAGNAVLVRYMPEYAKVPADCPAINVNRSTLTDHLRQIIRDRELRRRLAFEGRAFVEAHHDHVLIARQILQWLQAGEAQAFDFVPDFYRQLRLPDQKAAGGRAPQRKGR